MIRHRRASQDVPPDWLAKAVGLLAMSHRVKVTHSVVADLMDFLTWQWRQGRTARDAVAQTCLVNGKIVPSAATEIQEPDVKPPRGARPGQPFGAEELRRSSTVVRLEGKAARAKAKADAEDAKAHELEALASFARTTGAKTKLLQQAQFKRLQAEVLRDSMRDYQKQARSSSQGADPWRTVSPERPQKLRRTAQGQSCPPTQAGCNLGFPGGACGLPATLVLASSRGSPIPQVARFCLTSADRLIASHDARRGFAPRSDYPADVQERDYQRDKGEQLKVLSTAQNLIPELIFNGAPGAIDGLPVVTKEGIVLGGNGRTQALQLHYAHGGRVARDYLLDHAGQFGLTRAQVEEIADPVVVRVIDTQDRDAPGFRRAAQELVRLLNVSLTQSLSARTEAAAEARRISNEVLEILSVALSDGDQTLSDYLGSRSSATLAEALRRADILTDRNAVRLVSADGFTDEGKRFVERLLTAALLPDASLLDRLGPGTVATLAIGAPWLLSAAANGDAWDLRKPLQLAAKDLVELRTAKADSVESYLRQGGMFGKPAVLDHSMAEKLLKLLFELANKPSKFRSFARRFASIAASNPVNQTSLFAQERISPDTALEKAMETAR